MDGTIGKPTEQEAIEAWLVVRKQAGLQIDPATAEVEWTYGLTLGAKYGSLDDLPEATRQALWGKHESTFEIFDV